LKTLTRHWYNIGGVVAIGAIICLIILWNDLNMLIRLQTLNFIAILAHQFEEYGWPGGEPAITNIVMRNGGDIPDRYPLNQFSAMLTNILVTYIVYLLPIFLPNIIWLGLMPMLFGIFQIAAHGIVTNFKMKSIYNPGLGAVLLLHFPIGFYYIYYITQNGLASWLDWVFAVAYLLFLMLAISIGTYKLLPNKNTKYVFDAGEMERFHVKEKMERLRMKN
jgi:hypothetical protein